VSESSLQVDFSENLDYMRKPSTPLCGAALKRRVRTANLQGRRIFKENLQGQKAPVELLPDKGFQNLRKRRLESKFLLLDKSFKPV